MAFDEDRLNAQHDANASNEFYEILATKDVRSINGSAVQPQAFSLVVCHVSQYHKGLDDQRHGFLPCNDPVLELPSLQKIIAKNPDKEFFIVAFFYEASSLATVALFVRNIPRGVDTCFDDMLDSFVNSTEYFRNTLELSIQLGKRAYFEM